MLATTRNGGRRDGQRDHAECSKPLQNARPTSGLNAIRLRDRRLGGESGSLILFTKPLQPAELNTAAIFRQGKSLTLPWGSSSPATVGLRQTSLARLLSHPSRVGAQGA